MEDIKKIQEFFSKPVKENSRRSPDFILTEPAEIKYTESFGSGIKAPGVLHHANEGAFLGAEGAYIIVLPGGTFYVDEDKEEAIPIYPLKDQSRELQLALDYTPFSPKYETWKSWIKEPKTLEEAYIVTYAKNKGEKPSSVAYKLRGSALAFMRDLKKDGYTVMLTQKPVDGVDETLDEYNTGLYYDPAKERNAIKAKEASKTAMDRIKDMIKKIASEQKMGEALSDYEEKEANYDKLYGDYKYKVDEAKPKKGHGEKISKEVFAKLKGKTVNYKGADYKVIDSDEAVIKLKHEDGDTKTINLKQFNDSGLIDEIIETVLLGRQLNEKLCKKGEAYRKKRIAAGEKSSAYLNGRAVKVCKGQMKG